MTTFDKYIRENWRKARKLQKQNQCRNNISLLDNMYTDDGTLDSTDKLEPAEIGYEDTYKLHDVVVTNTNDATRSILTKQETRRKSKLQIAREKIARHRMKSSRSKSI